MKKVRDIYAVAKQKNIPMLSNYNADFWSEYVTNFSTYDALFNRAYTTFRYFVDASTDIEEVQEDFTSAVLGHLIINRKKYEELYRVYTLADDNYSLTDNYDITETMDRDTTGHIDDTYGSRNDSNSMTNKVVPYDTTSEYEDSSSSNSFSKGQELDNRVSTGTEDYTLHRKGNIGVQTVTDMITKHDTYWSKYRFYTMIFENISRDLLLV